LTIKILFLTANPEDTNRLRLDLEVRAIDQVLRKGEYREIFDLKQQWATRVIDLQEYLLRHRPDIVHFSGHGSSENSIILEENNQSGSHPVPAESLGELFSILKENIRCVILNACYSETQAQAIANHIDCVIGMSDTIGDFAAISFAAAFYQALAYGKDVKTAFELGRVQLGLQNLEEQHVPKLITEKGDGSDIVFFAGAKVLPEPSFPQVISPRDTHLHRIRSMTLDLPDIPLTCVPGKGEMRFNSLMELYELYPVARIKQCILRGKYWACSEAYGDRNFFIKFTYMIKKEDGDFKASSSNMPLSYETETKPIEKPSTFYGFFVSVSENDMNRIQLSFRRTGYNESVYITVTNMELEVIYESLH
jgi:hypothetical protein